MLEQCSVQGAGFHVRADAGWELVEAASTSLGHLAHLTRWYNTSGMLVGVVLLTAV